MKVNANVVTGGYLHMSGMLEGLKKALKDAGIGYTIYDEVTPNPTILNVELARALEQLYYDIMEDTE